MRTPLALSQVTIADAFWSPRREVVRTRTIPHQEKQLREYGQVDALALDWQPGQREPHIFWESDIAKWIEAASQSLVHHPDQALDAALDDVIARLAGAQQPDGYLNAAFTTALKGQRFTDLQDAHELYCLGHLIEAAVAHHQATGKRSLLDVVERYLALVETQFGPGGPLEGGYCGHEEIELALVRLADFTGEQRHLELASRFVDARGTHPHFFEAEAARRGTPGYFGTVLSDDPQRLRHQHEYNQSHLPVREQDEAVGHAVRAMYLYSAMADLALRLGDNSLTDACLRLWTSVTEQKMTVTGGIGADASIEGFRGPYDLPNNLSYNETCASIGLVMWAQRMALLTGEGRFVDVAELALYNTVLAGASLDGTTYFYGNPMTSQGEHQRQGWFDCACCPPNFARLLTALEGHAYAHSEDEAIVELYCSGTATFPLPSGPVRVEVRTDYPWQGQVRLTVLDEADLTLAVRVPGWADGARANLNGDTIEVTPDRGHLRLRRSWRAGDELVLDLPMRVQRLWAHPLVSADAGQVALRRGPLVHCVEGVDHEVPVWTIALPRTATFSVEWDDNLGVSVLQTEAVADQVGDSPELYRVDPPTTTHTSVRAIPYYAWANRGATAMRVWLRDLPC